MLVDLGMAALPTPVEAKPLVPGLKPLGTTPRRANMLVLIEAKGMAAGQSSRTTRPPHTAAQGYRGRY